MQALQGMRAKDLVGKQKDVTHIRKHVETRRQHMTLVNRCHFQLKGTTKLDEFVSTLREYIQVLRNICSDVQADVCPA